MSDFWARRKAAVLAEENEEAQRAVDAVQERLEAEQAERSDEEILAELDLPDPDTLGQGDDFKVFLNEAVPARIRTRALRRLWRLNPILANVDGLVDYGEDFTDASCVLENLQTAYQVGKGMTHHVLEMTRKAEEAAAGENEGTEMGAEAEGAVGASIDVPDHGTVSDAQTEVCADVAPPPEPATPYAFEDPLEGPLSSASPVRRMRFAFDAPSSGVST